MQRPGVHKCEAMWLALAKLGVSSSTIQLIQLDGTPLEPSAVGSGLRQACGTSAFQPLCVPLCGKLGGRYGWSGSDCEVQTC